MHKKEFFPLYCVHISRFHSAVTSNHKSFSPAATLDPRPRLWTRDSDIGPATATLDPRPRLWTRDPRPATISQTQVWHRFKHFHWLRIYSWQECRFSTNQRARNRSVTGETLIGPYRPPRNDVKMFKTQVQYKPQASVIKVYQFGTFQLTSVNSQGLYQNWSKFPRFLPKLLQLTLRCVNFF